MKKNPNELDENRLATTDLSGKRIYLYPEEVKGLWAERREIFYYLLIALYLIVPWTHVNGNPTILIDIPNREFFIFGAHFYAHNIPLLFIILITFILGIGLITAVKGRVWCGWACPQTVFIESVFRKIETLVEGNARVRHRLDDEPMSVKKFLKKTIKWSLFTITSLILSHSFLAYFVPTYKLIDIIQHSPATNYTLFTVMLFITGVFLFDFGWFREQFCIIACPYGRFQSVLMDKDTTVVMYDYNRGEPRKENNQHKDHGDCINCFKCVQVCPTGIDIRRGTQLECIHCTRCIDECDSIMERIHKPKGLIRYGTERELEEGKTKVISPRVIIYSAILAILVLVGGTIIYQSKELDVLFVRGTKSPYQVVMTKGEEKIVNHYKAEILYRTGDPLDLSFKVDDPRIEVVSPMGNRLVKSSRKTNLHIFFKFKKSVLKNGSLPIDIEIVSKGKTLKKKKISLVGPY